MGPLTTYKFGGPARWFVAAEDVTSLVNAVDAALADGVGFLVVGRGSNLVFSDAGFDGLVVQMAGDFRSIVVATSGEVIAGAAVPLPSLARTCAKADRGGLEFLVAVPGSVGGAVRMNAGCHGSETGEWLMGAHVYRAGHGLLEVGRDEMEMTYRHNSLPEHDIVLGAKFRTELRRRAESEALMREITRWRKLHQPGGTFNAGSVFKNPPGNAAGRLIEEAGLKGLSIGGATVSTKHANFFEAAPGAVAQDVYDLVWETRRRVMDASGIELELEIRFAGAFRSHAADMRDLMMEEDGQS